MRAPGRSSAHVVILMAVAAMAACGDIESQTPSPSTGAQAAPSNPAPAQESFVDAIGAILHEYVDEHGGVDYAGLKQDRDRLDACVASLGDLDPAAIAAWPAPQRIAFWINAYNAITLQRIVDHYPIRRGGIVSGLRFPENSIRQIDGVWDTITTRVAGREMTLDHIEHEILRKEFREPRIHAALVCAAKSCPPLRNEAYTAERLNEQLDDQSRHFLAAPQRFNIDREKKIVRLSLILKWYGEDFIGIYNATGAFPGRSPAEGAALDYTSRFVSPEDADFIRTQSYRVEFLDYDWSLNEQD